MRVLPNEPLRAASPGRWITWRSVLLGTAAVVLVNGLVPYNDFVVANAFLVGSYLPVVLVVSYFVLIVLINGPLHRFAPRYALRSGELAVIMTMMLVACSIPSQGLMRPFIPQLVVPFHFGRFEPTFWRTFLSMDLPQWLFPVGKLSEGLNSPVVTSFYSRLQPGEQVPYAAWVIPLAGWGVFIFAMFATLLALATILRPQWATNERLAFPVAQLQSALIEPPRPGRMLNEVMGNRLFWMALIAVFVIHTAVATNKYFPKYMPLIPTRYNLTTLFADAPWNAFSGLVKTAQVYFTFIGLAYFIQSRIAFSLWSIFLITQLINVWLRQMHADIPGGAWQDQNFGASVAFVLGVAYIGRHHLRTVVLQMIRGARPGESRGEYLSYRVASYIVLIGLLVMVGWLMMLGVSGWMALGIVGVLMIAHVIVARVVAETGLASVRAQLTYPQIYTNWSPANFSAQDVYFGGVFTSLGAYTTRESLMAFYMHGEQVTEQTNPAARQRRALLALVAWSLVLGYVTAAGSSLYCYYSYATPITDRENQVLNSHLLETLPKIDVVQPLTRYANGQFESRSHSPALHVGIGFVVTSLLYAASLRWTSWPFAPVGYLVCTTWMFQVVWFSIFLGWLVKVLVIRFGGASLFKQLRPFFLGLIFGEALAAGALLAINLCLASAGYEYYVVDFLPK